MAEGLTHIEICPVDDPMDMPGGVNRPPPNALPVKCGTCRFPDIDFVPSPYLLVRGLESSKEFVPTNLGNVVVRERVRRVLEAVAPGEVRFVPTAGAKTKQPASWWLAVPVTRVRLHDVKASVPRCPDCGEPKVAHPGSHFVPLAKPPGPIAVEMFKDEAWGSSEKTTEDWDWSPGQPRGPLGRPPWTRRSLSRDLWMSVRLEALLKRLKVVGVQRSIAYKEKPSPADLQWVDRQIAALAGKGLAAPPAVDAGAGAGQWFDQYLRKAAKKKPAAVDFEAFEMDHGVTLPASYKQFITAVGRKTFRDVDDEEGFDVTVLPPAKLELSGEWVIDAGDLDEESAQVKPLMFGRTDHGDCFVFDLAAKGVDKSKGAEYPVLWYQHEMNMYEPYAPSFAACIKRFVG
jgi:hypothetical protein